MEIVKAELTDVETLAELNKHLIEDERHPDPMNIAQLTQRMKARGWQPIISAMWRSRMGTLSATAYTEMTVNTTICGNCM